MKKLLTHGFAAAFLFGGTALVAHAAVSTYKNPITYGGITDIPGLFLALVDLVFLIGVPVIVLFIIYAGFLFVSAGDNESEIKKAKTTFTWTVVGALVLLGAKALALAIQGTLTSLQ
jgi:hypothetical protein